MTAFDDDLRLAHVLADSADAITMGRYKARDLVVESKPDMTPVSDADKAAEEAIRSALSRARPRDAMLGEEFGETAVGATGRKWIIDPIDGTKNYVRGVPVWATLIGLLDGEEVVAGVVSAPALGRRWWAAKGGGAFTGRSLASAQRCHVSKVAAIGNASFAHASVTAWEEYGKLDSFLDLCRACWRTRAFGDFWSHMLVAEGAMDIAAEPELSLWDMAALAVIVTEAGGMFTSVDGVPGVFGGSAAVSNGLLHEELLYYVGSQHLDG